MTPKALEPEGPMSPPTSTNILSPPPPKNRAYAGHTPLKAEALSAATTPGQDTPTARNTAQNVEASASQDDSSIKDLPDDPVLRGPLSLSNTPEHGEQMLQALEDKLRDAAEFPGHSRPTVLQGVVSEDGDASETNGEGAPEQSSLEEPPADGSTLDAGPILKVRRSMNFGAPIGALPGKQFSSP
jgi:hypothetical protein